jgi:hypothetical protein
MELLANSNFLEVFRLGKDILFRVSLRVAGKVRGEGGLN